MSEDKTFRVLSFLVVFFFFFAIKHVCKTLQWDWGMTSNSTFSRKWNKFLDSFFKMELDFLNFPSNNPLPLKALKGIRLVAMDELEATRFLTQMKEAQ